ncbi:MAG TPA: hypothetical protein VMU49_09055 [Candidatus Acidoferrales bacterium]|nr:hypothetical protein [Candidatus Acidoferrales bacterium]
MALRSMPTATGLAADLALRRRVVLAAAVLVAAGAGFSIADLVFGNGMAASALVALGLAVAIWMAPWTGLLAVMLGATVVEQFTLMSSGSFPDISDQIPLFRSLASGAGLPGVYASPFEVLLGFALLVWLARGIANHQLSLPKSKLSLAIGLFSVFVLFALVRGGGLRNSLWELRPWMYLVVTYVLSSQLLKTEKHLRVLLWTFAIGVGLKSLQGVILFALHSTGYRPQSFLEHAESFFFGIFLALTLGLWLFAERGALRRFMTAMTPLVLISDMLNQRRTAWAIVALLTLVTLLLAFVRMPQHRRKLAVAVGIMGFASVAYYAAFSNHAGFIGQPARAFRSAVFPDARDKQSNLYRTVENVDLGIAIRQSTPFGTGFGHTIPQQVQNVNITNQDSFIGFVPHNGVLYVWLRFGLAGAACFWMMIAMAIMMACQAFRDRRGTTMLLAFTVILAVLAYVVQGAYDMGFYWFRMAVLMGTLLGALEVARQLPDRSSSGPEKPLSRVVGPKGALTPFALTGGRR